MKPILEGFPLGKIIKQNTILDLIVELVLGISNPFKKVAPRGKFPAVFTYLQLVRTRKRERDQNSKMTKKNTQSCQIALNIFKMSELNFKSQLDLLQTAISLRKSFRTLTLLIDNIKETKEELRKAAEKVFLENPHPSRVSSITERQSNFLSKLQIFEHEVNSLDDDGQLSQSYTRLRVDISVS